MGKDSFQIVKKHLDVYDYMGLLAAGCPLDEFDEEARDISLRISSESSAEEIAEVVAQVFASQFNTPEKAAYFQDTAEKIRQELITHKRY